ncbi:nitroreductase family protein [Aurantiacibacter poecillastricola]|uniref:nitroreductase family protein n=1 Tax=Aurantiacibacter poecillastricola TaxID=3064385 RepID=UPI00273D7B0D|nr:nitroreductase family protein [Aurantiacibacter sp. 219JJ12-13]MDP5260014.1 nitroreductase family protein [Aurantiacibacter sp. 219JJ12-13]
MKQHAILLADYLYDLRRFARHSAFGKDPEREARHLQARLMIAAHGIEKGLSFARFEPRRGLGKLRNALAHMRRHRALGLPEDDAAYLMARDAIVHYRRKHAEQGVDIADLFEGEEHLFEMEGEAASSIRTLERGSLTDAEREALRKGMLSRASIREFGDEPMTAEQVRAVVTDALSTPSVCNRQGFRAHYTLDRAVIDAALAHQNGNSGFGARVPGLLVVTCTQTIFRTPAERNQAFVDGGLFSMSLMLALTAHELGGCPLNWSASHRQDMALRGAVSIPEDEAIIMMIAFGPLPDVALAAGSRRYDLDTYLSELTRRERG